MSDGDRAERDLVERARAGSLPAYEELVRRHQQIAYRTAFVVTRSAPDAEEAAQDAFVKAWAALDRFRAGAPFRPWLLAIVANEARTKLRAGARRQAWTRRAADHALIGGVAAGPSAETTALEHERSGRLRDALDRLTERDRTVIELRYLLDLSEQDAAAALGCRIGTVKSRLSRAMERLRTELEERP